MDAKAELDEARERNALKARVAALEAEVARLTKLLDMETHSLISMRAERDRQRAKIGELAREVARLTKENARLHNKQTMRDMSDHLYDIASTQGLDDCDEMEARQQEQDEFREMQGQFRDAEAEVTRLKAQLATVAERQREAIAQDFSGGDWMCSGEELAQHIRSTPLVTEGE